MCERNRQEDLVVYLYGEPIGTLYYVDHERADSLGFRYLAETSRAFSVAFPNPDKEGKAAIYSGRALYQWFNNALPEGTLKDLYARRANADIEKVYEIIKGNAGAEYIGAISFCEQGAEQEYRHVPERNRTLDIFEITERNGERAPDDIRPTAVSGATTKTGITIDSRGEWYTPVNESSYSTHVLKINPRRLERTGLEFVEVCSQETLRRLGIAAAPTHLAVLDDVQAILSERFDRRTDLGRKSTIIPVHQEDFLAAAGGSPYKKHIEYITEQERHEWAAEYGYSKLALLLEENSNNPEEEKAGLVNLVAATYLIGDADKHPKNIALLHSGRDDDFSVKLSPAYDTVSLYGVAKKGMSQHQAIPIGGEYHRDRISAKAIRQFADEIRAEPGFVEQVFTDTAEKMPDIFHETSREKLKSEPVLNRDSVHRGLEDTMRRINRECKRLLQVYRQRSMKRPRTELAGRRM